MRSTTLDRQIVTQIGHFGRVVDRSSGASARQLLVPFISIEPSALDEERTLVAQKWPSDGTQTAANMSRIGNRLDKPMLLRKQLVA